MNAASEDNGWSHGFEQATTPVAVLLIGWAMGIHKADLKVLLNVSFIVIGVIIASVGEIKFVLIGVIFQLGGILFEAVRLVMVERLLSSAEYKMDPLVSLYYFAPVCAIMNFCTALVFEIPRIQMEELYHVGLWTLLANAMVAFGLNVSVVFLVRKGNLTSLQVLIILDWQNIGSSDDSLRRPQGYSARWSLHRYLGYPHISSPILWLQHCPRWTHLLQAWSHHHQSPVLGSWPPLG